MKLKSFRIKNYKSIIDSGECHLSDNDNILILAGQNESGKSSILQALRDFETGELIEDAVREFDNSAETPIIECTFQIENEDLVTIIKSELEGIDNNLSSLFKRAKTITLVREFDVDRGSSLGLGEDEAHSIVNIETLLQLERGSKTTLVESTESLEEVTSDELEAESGNRKNVFDPTISANYQIAEVLFQYTPKIIFFDDFCDLLPKSISISDLSGKKGTVKGYNAVRNIEKILNCKLADLDTMKDHKRRQTEDHINTTLTLNFNERWKQKIFEVNEVQIKIEYEQGAGKENGPYLNFYILTRNGEYLRPNQRSMGLKWFLSFYLELKAQSETSDDLVILFDEPGLYLHSKAQQDIKRLFAELAEKDQIIFSTHSPYMIDANKLGRVRLVINDVEDGTTIEKVTTDRSDGKKLDALKPIIDAMGMEVANYFTPADKKNLIVEGISDFYYFRAMKKILDNLTPYSILPSMGADNVHLLMELCIGWGLEWTIIFDDDKQSNNAANKIKQQFQEDAISRIYMMKGCSSIEDAFTQNDLKMINPAIIFTAGKKNSELVSAYGGKELFARTFLEKVECDEITENKLSVEAKEHFIKAFRFVDDFFTEKPKRRFYLRNSKSVA